MITITEISEYPIKTETIERKTKKYEYNALEYISLYYSSIKNNINANSYINKSDDDSVIQIFSRNTFDNSIESYIDFLPVIDRLSHLTIDIISDILDSNITHSRYGYRYMFNGSKMIFVKENGEGVFK